MNGRPTANGCSPSAGNPTHDEQRKVTETKTVPVTEVRARGACKPTARRPPRPRLGQSGHPHLETGSRVGWTQRVLRPGRRYADATASSAPRKPGSSRPPRVHAVRVAGPNAATMGLSMPADGLTPREQLGAGSAKADSTARRAGTPGCSRFGATCARRGKASTSSPRPIWIRLSARPIVDLFQRTGLPPS